jgi:hypothetical protein
MAWRWLAEVHAAVVAIVEVVPGYPLEMPGRQAATVMSGRNGSTRSFGKNFGWIQKDPFGKGPGRTAP